MIFHKLDDSNDESDAIAHPLIQRRHNEAPTKVWFIPE
jgi:hypothetical protein